MSTQRHRVRMPAWPVSPRPMAPGTTSSVMLPTPFPGWGHSARTLLLIRLVVPPAVPRFSVTEGSVTPGKRAAKPVRTAGRPPGVVSMTGVVLNRDQLAINPGLPRSGWGPIVIEWGAIGGDWDTDLGVTAVSVAMAVPGLDRLRLSDEQAGSLAAALIRQAFEQVARVPGAARVEAWLWLFGPFASRLHGGIGLEAEAGRAWAWEHGVRLRGSAGANFSPDQTIYTTSEPFRLLPEIALLAPSGMDPVTIHDTDYGGWPEWIRPFVDGTVAGRTRETYGASLAAYDAGARELGDALREIAKHGQPRPYLKVSGGHVAGAPVPAGPVTAGPVAAGPVAAGPVTAGVCSHRTVPTSGAPVNRSREEPSRWQ